MSANKIVLIEEPVSRTKYFAQGYVNVPDDSGETHRFDLILSSFVEKAIQNLIKKQESVEGVSFSIDGNILLVRTKDNFFESESVEIEIISFKARDFHIEYPWSGSVNQGQTLSRSYSSESISGYISVEQGEVLFEILLGNEVVFTANVEAGDTTHFDLYEGRKVLWTMRVTGIAARSDFLVQYG